MFAQQGIQARNVKSFKSLIKKMNLYQPRGGKTNLSPGETNLTPTLVSKGGNYSTKIESTGYYYNHIRVSFR